MEPKILITGTGRGVGKFIYSQFKKHDIIVESLTRSNTPQEFIDKLYGTINQSYDMIIHCAANVNHYTWENYIPYSFYNDNIFLTKDLISIPSFTMAKGFHFDFKHHDPQREPVVEIYNSWGSSECTAKEGNPRPIKASGKKGVSEVAEGSIRAALNNGHRFGFVAGGLDDRGIYADFFQSDQEQYSPGITAIIAGAQARDSFSAALMRRACYATTGARMILGFQIAGKNMGSELSTATKPGLAYNRHITGHVAATSPITEIIIFRNGQVFHTYHPNELSFDFTLDDSDPLHQVTLGSKQTPFVYYYVRVMQEDGHIGWASPIWVDLQEAEDTSPKKLKRK